VDEQPTEHASWNDLPQLRPQFVIAALRRHLVDLVARDADAM
jgi:hypothetical protein